MATKHQFQDLLERTELSEVWQELLLPFPPLCKSMIKIDMQIYKSWLFLSSRIDRQIKKLSVWNWNPNGKRTGMPSILRFGRRHTGNQPRVIWMIREQDNRLVHNLVGCDFHRDGQSELATRLDLGG